MARTVQPAERTASLPAADVQERLHAFREYMLIHTEMDWSVERMAGSVHLSAPRFYVVYRNLFGVTPMLDLRYARAERAKNLLLSGRYTVTEVAELAGYANVYQFIRSFRQLTGMTPGQLCRAEIMNNIGVDGSIIVPKKLRFERNKASLITLFFRF